jgi:nucleotide-binding universal stress UspA family protein
MIALKRILVPHDFSEPSNAAVTYARGIAQAFQSSIDVLHVVPELAGEHVSGAPESVRQRLTTDVEVAEARSIGAEAHVRCGTPHLEISRFARDRDIDLVVMGTHGRGFIGHALLGSVAEKVVRTAPCPVLTVRGPQRGSAVPQILVALDFQAASDTALTYGRTLARRFGGTLHVLHVMENYFLRPTVSDPSTLVWRARNQVSDRLTDKDYADLHATVAVEVSDEPADAIVDYAVSSAIDLIVIGTHGRTGADRLLMGSVAERVVRTAPCPVLTVHHPEREFAWPDRADTEARTAEG